jgi:signal transduction histidine kinase
VLRQLVRNLLGNTRPKILTHVLIVDPDPGFGTDRREFVANAFKFTPDGGQITVSAEPREGEAVVTVRDTGRGIDPKKIPSLFQKFQRLESSEPQDGLGLGLYIVKELVTAHGGRTEVEGVIGQGSAFSIFLPL